MTEFQCSALIDNKTYNFLTCGSVTLSHAKNSFKQYLRKEHGADLEACDCASFDRVETDE